MSTLPLPPTPPSGWRGFLPRLRRRYTDKQLAGSVSMVAAFGITVGLAVWGSSDSPPSLGGAAAITVVAGMLQFAGIWALSRGQGTANTEHAQSSVRNLLLLFVRVQTLKEAAEKMLRKRNTPADELRRHLGIVSVELEMVSERTATAVSDWKQFHPDAVERAERERLEGP